MATLQVVIVLCAGMLLIIGGSIGHSLSQRQLKRRIKRQAELQRTIGEQWRALQKDRSRRSRNSCPSCRYWRDSLGGDETLR